MRKCIKNLLLKLMNVISVLIILASIAALLTVVLAKPGEAPNFFGYSLFRVMTGSMEPTIHTNSLIVVQRTDPQQLVEGDIITFYSRDPALMGEPNTHRIVRFEQDGDQRLIHTKGDANNIDDRYPVHEEDVIGKVVYSSLKLGNFVRLISNPVIFIPLIIIPLAIMLLKSLYDGIIAAKNLAKEEEEAAVREALAELREKRKAASAEQSADTESETEQVKTEANQEDEPEKITREEMTNLVNGTAISAIDTKIKTNSYKEVATMSTGERIVTANDQRQWKERYGVRQRSQKRKQLRGGKWNR
ncbi:MAG: signal peptidase I [Lachnospiraceae bacterium]|jgi:signal peptidase I|nr:signal peptidase I [Lachnospiraceae bacterium]